MYSNLVGVANILGRRSPLRWRCASGLRAPPAMPHQTNWGGAVMVRRLLMVLSALGLVAMFAVDANAGCITLSGGSRYCAAWITGSEICNVTIQGLTDNEATVTCTVDELSPGAGVPGTAYCVPNDTDILSSAKTTANDACRHHFSGIGTGHTNSPGLGHVGDCQAVPNSTIPTAQLPLIASSSIAQCDTKGVCKTTLELDPEDCPTCCPAGSHLVTFTASEFRAGSQLDGSCGDGPCAVLDERCTLNSGGHRYDCVPFFGDGGGD